MLEMRFLGLPHITFDGQPLTAFQRSSTLTRLLAFLVIHRDQLQHRLCLATAFWPELPEPRARRTLNNILWRLRVALSNCDSTQRYVLTEGETVQFNPQARFWLDVHEFERLTGALKLVGDAPLHLSGEQLREIESAVALYQSDFLEGILDDWCIPIRERLHERCLLALDALAQAHQSAARLDLALEASQRLVRADPYRESAYQRLIELYVSLHRMAEARAAFERYETLWRDELGLAPSSRMLELASRHNLNSDHAPKQIAVPSNEETLMELETALQPPNASSANAEYLRRELDIRRRCDELYDLRADRKKQSQNLDRAEALANALGEPAARVDVLARRIWLGTRQGDYPNAISAAQQALRICREKEDRAQQALIHRLMGIACQESGDFKAALAHYIHALKLSECLGRTEEIAADLNNVASVNIVMANYIAALAYLERALGLHPPNLTPPIRVKLLGNNGIVWMKLGQLHRAGDCLKQAMALAQQIGARGAEWWLAARLASFYHLSGASERALYVAHHYHRIAEPVGDAWVVADLLDVLSQLYCDGGDGNKALHWGNQLQHHAEKGNLWRFQMRGLMRMAEASFLLKQMTESYRSIQRAIGIRNQRPDQQLAEDPELFYLSARCAESLGHSAIADIARHRAGEALKRLLSNIPDEHLRNGVLQAQRFTASDLLSSH